MLFFTAPCPPVCSHEFCSKKRNRKKPCSRYINIASLAYSQCVFNRPPPHLTSAGCPNQCHSTYCNACYYSETPRSPPKQCKNRVCANELVTADCLKRWAKCVGRKDRRYNKVAIATFICCIGSNIIHSHYSAQMIAGQLKTSNVMIILHAFSG